VRENVSLTPKRKLSAWDKITIGSWRINGDSQVYCEIKLPVEKALSYIEKKNQGADFKITITHFVGAVMGRILKKYPDVNVMLRFSKIYFRNQANIFFHIADKADLSGTCLKEVDKKTVQEIAKELSGAAKDIRSKEDKTFKKIKHSWSLVPVQLSKWVLDLIQFIIYQLNIYVKSLGMPKDPFGGMMITNIGSLGFDSAFVPLAPYTHVPIICALGKVRFEPVCNEKGELETRKIVSLCITFDHRILDGYRGSLLSKELKRYFDSPELLDHE
tara:strand:+ start:27509 stop:28327 length:819 start_codon:yes stop_codon:yes gene_type:complete